MTATHTVKFERNTKTGRYRAACDCGWTGNDGNLEVLQVLAAGHDLEWVEVKPSTVLGAG